VSSSYPDAIDSFTTKVDGVDSVLASHVNDLQDAVVAVETAIGAPPVFLTDVYSPIINGGMDIWQRGTSFATIADGTYGPDRWLYQKSGAMVHTLSQSTDYPQITANGATRKFNYSLQLALTTPDTAIAAGDYCVLTHKIEGYNWLKLDGQPITVGFWVWSDVAGTYCVALRNSGADRSCVAEYTIGALEVQTWVFKSVTFPANDNTSGTWNFTNGVGVQLHFTLAAGSTYQTTADAWQTGSFFATSSQVNGVNTGVTPFRVTGVDVVLGSSPRSIVPFDIGVEYGRCLRYYWKTGTGGATRYGLAYGMALATTSARMFVPTPVPMRTNPAVSGFENVYCNGTAAAITSITNAVSVPNGVWFIANVAAGLTANHPAICNNEVASTGAVLDIEL